MTRPAVRTSVAGKVLADLKAQATSRVTKRIPSLGDESAHVERRRRFELLDMKNEDDRIRWQVLHNDQDRYEVISEKFSQVKGVGEGEYTCSIVYDELGDGLPLVKTQHELRSQDRKARNNADISNRELSIEDFNAQS